MLFKSFVSIFLSALMIFVPFMAEAQIKVIESTGAGTGQKAVKFKQTIVKFKSKETIPIYNILAQSSSIGTDSRGGTTSSYGQTFTRLCNAPGTIQVEGGVYTFRAGSNMSLDPTFTVEATGGTQVWDVETGSFGLFMGGVFIFSFGLTLGIVGTVVPEYSPILPGPAWFGVGVIGLVMLFQSFGTATLETNESKVGYNNPADMDYAIYNKIRKDAVGYDGTENDIKLMNLSYSHKF